MALISKEYFGCTIIREFDYYGTIGYYYTESDNVHDPRIKYDFFKSGKQKFTEYNKDKYLLDIYGGGYSKGYKVEYKMVLASKDKELEEESNKILEYAKESPYVQCTVNRKYVIGVSKKFKTLGNNGIAKALNTLYNSVQVKSDNDFTPDRYDKAIEFIDKLKTAAEKIYSIEKILNDAIESVKC